MSNHKAAQTYAAGAKYGERKKIKQENMYASFENQL